MAKKGFSRRDFLKGVSAAGVAAGLFGMGTKVSAAPSPPGQNNIPPVLHTDLLPPPDISGSGERFWANVRKAFILPKDYIHMNTGTTGSQPLFSLSNLAVYNLWKSVDPRDWERNLNAEYPGLFPLGTSLFGPSATAARQKWAADAFGANPDEIVLSYNTTDACNYIFSGTPWNPGDRIVTTQFEHPACNGPMAWARDYRGVQLVMVNIPSNFTASITVPEVLSWFQAELSKPLPAGAKQYLVISEIFYKNGVRMPVKELCQLAKSYGAYTIVDTAHGWGMLPINCHEYEADFIAGAGHKWLCGGPGTGIWYIRNSGSNLPPFAMGNFFLYGDPFTAPSGFYNNRNWAPSAWVQFRGEVNTPALYAMTDSLSFFTSIGLDDIYNRGVTLGNYLKDKVANEWGPNALWVQKNSDPAFATFLTSFNPFKDKNDPTKYAEMNTAMNTVLATLAAEDPKIYIRTVNWRDQASNPNSLRVGFRVSTHAMYNNYQEIDWMFERLVAAVDATGLPQLP
jgi:selenocysteine lyase/cysteine desulfurase